MTNKNIENVVASLAKFKLSHFEIMTNLIGLR